MSETLLASRFADLRTQIDAELPLHLDRMDWPPRLQEAVAYSLMAGGKRLRPVLTLLAAEVCGSDPVVAMPAACAVEMIHTYSLIHDDLPAMDDDDFRRGRPTSHRVFGEALAILAGDCLLTLAFETLAAADLGAAVRIELVRLLAAAAGGAGMVGGQVLDLEAEQARLAGSAGPGQSARIIANPVNGDSADSVEQLYRIHAMKTGALITTSLELGAVAAGASPDDRRRLVRYGRAAGLAFQIADDLLDVGGSGQRLGKSTGRDAERGKLTAPALIGIEASRRQADELIGTACEAAEEFGERGARLVELARFIVERDH